MPLVEHCLRQSRWSELQYYSPLLLIIYFSEATASASKEQIFFSFCKNSPPLCHHLEPSGTPLLLISCFVGRRGEVTAQRNGKGSCSQVQNGSLIHHKPLPPLQTLILITRNFLLPFSRKGSGEWSASSSHRNVNPLAIFYRSFLPQYFSVMPCWICASTSTAELLHKRSAYNS